MIIETGHFALVLAFALSLLQSVIPIWGAVHNDRRFMAVASPVAIMLFVLIAISYGALTWGYISSDFSVLNVFENSHSARPLIFKISGVWSNHEGSMLLWVMILGIFGGLLSVFGRNIPAPLKSASLGVQAWVTAAFLLFILTTSNPFLRMAHPMAEGQDLNPVLQDIGLAIHPPLLYLGYVGFSIAFSFATAALILGRIDAAWARWVRPWVLLAWIFLTLGIAMGSYWAYYELGWGGWWFWDPVENASFMPWLAGTALLHSTIVMEKREALKVWTILLAIFTFSLSLLGTFLVRSGVLTSVHAFATDPSRGVFILILLCLFIGGSLSLYAWRAPTLKQGGLFAPISREGGLVLNNLFLSAACVAVFVGTLYPLALEVLTGAKITVGAPFFDLTFGPLMIPLFLCVPFGPLLAWKRGDLVGAAQRLYAAFGLSILIVLVTYWALGAEKVLAPLGAGLAAWVMLGALADVVTRSRIFQIGVRRGVARLVGLPRSAWGTMLGHFGLGVTALGIVISTATQQELILTIQPNQTVQMSGFDITYKGASSRRVTNYEENMAHFLVTRDGKEVAEMEPSKRVYSGRSMPISEVSLKTFLFSQLYISLGESKENGATDVRIYYKPLVTLIWLGALLMAFGGICSLSDRRHRVGAPKPAKARNKVASAAPSPAE